MTTDNENTQGTQNSPQFNQDDDEISLIDLWNVLWKWKKLALIVLAAVFIFSLGYVITATRVYESISVISVGFFETEEDNSAPKKKFIEDPGLIAAKAREQYGITAEVSKNKNETNILTLKAKAEDPASAQEKLQNALNSLIGHHEEIIEKYDELVDFNLQLKKTQEAKLFDMIHQYEDRIRAVERQNPALAAIMTIDKRTLFEKVIALQETIEKMETNPDTATPTQILREPSLPGTPFKPKTQLVLALSVILGLFLGIFSAFFAEFVQKARDSYRA